MMSATLGKAYSAALAFTNANLVLLASTSTIEQAYSSIEWCTCEGDSGVGSSSNSSS